MRVLGFVVALALVAGAASADLLVNGSFEAGLDGWTNVGQLNWATDGLFPHPGTPPDGDHWLSGSHTWEADWGFSNRFRLVQSVSASGPMTLSGQYFTGGAWGNDCYIEFQLIDGADGGTVVDSHTYQGWNWQWDPVSLSGTTTSGTTTVAIEFRGNHGAHGANVDAMVLVPEPGMVLLGLAGLALLRRRR